MKDIHRAPPTAKKQQTIVPGAKRKQLCLNTLLPMNRVNDGSQSSLPTNVEKSSPTTIPTCADTPSESLDMPSATKKKRSFHPMDVYYYIEKANTLSDAEKYDLMCNVWKPDENYRFPADPKSPRRFQHSWLTLQLTMGDFV